MKTKIMNQLVKQNKAVLLGELLYVGKDPTLYYDRLAKVHGFQLNGVGEPKYHLGGDFLAPTYKANENVDLGIKNLHQLYAPFLF